jgi:hypothetical protein
VDGTLSPDGKWVSHGMKWVPAMLSPDGGHYAHEGKWHPILQTPLNTEEEDPIYVTKSELNYTIATFLSLAMLVIGGIALYVNVETSTRLLSVSVGSWLSPTFRIPEANPVMIGIGRRYTYSFAVGTISAMVCLVGLLGSRTGKIGIRTAKISSLAAGLLFLWPYLMLPVEAVRARIITGSWTVGFLPSEIFIGSYLPSILAGVIGVMLHIYCRRKLS